MYMCLWEEMKRIWRLVEDEAREADFGQRLARLPTRYGRPVRSYLILMRKQPQLDLHMS